MVFRPVGDLTSYTTTGAEYGMHASYPSSVVMTALPAGTLFVQWGQTLEVPGQGKRIAVFDEAGTVISGSAEGRHIKNFSVGFTAFGSSGFLATLIEAVDVKASEPVRYKLLRYDERGVPDGSAFFFETGRGQAQDWSYEASPDGGFRIGWQESGGGRIRRYEQGFDEDAVAFGPADILTSRPAALPDLHAALPDQTYLGLMDLGEGVSNGILVRRFDRDGAQVGQDMRITDAAAGAQDAAALVAAGSGMQAVLYEIDGHLFGRMLGPNGAPYDAEFEIAKAPDGLRMIRAISLAEGGFVVAWVSDIDGGTKRIDARRYDETGTALGEVVEISSPSETITGFEGSFAGFDMIQQDDGEVIGWWKTYSTSGQGVAPFKAQRIAVDPADAKPVIAVEGERAADTPLTASLVWPRDDPIPGVQWQWMRDGVDIPGETTATYTPDFSDLDAVIGVRAVTEDGAVTRPQVGDIGGGPADLVTIDGAEVVGGMLQAVLPDAGLPDGTTLTWTRDGVPIDGATADSLVLTQADWGTRVGVTITVPGLGSAPTEATGLVASGGVDFEAGALGAVREPSQYGDADPSLLALMDGGYRLDWVPRSNYGYGSAGKQFTAAGDEAETIFGYAGGGDIEGRSSGPASVELTDGRILKALVSRYRDYGGEGGGAVEWDLWLRASDDDGGYLARREANISSFEADYSLQERSQRAIEGIDMVALAGGAQAVLAWNEWTDSEALSLLQFVLTDDRDTILTFGGAAQTVTAAPRLAALPDGGFVAVWQGRVAGQDDGIHLQRFGAEGVSAGDSVEITIGRPGGQASPTLALLSDGTLAVAWDEVGPDDNRDIVIQRMDADGGLLGAAVRIDDRTGRDQHEPVLAAAEDGGWVIGWRETVDTDLGERLQFQLFDAVGRPTSGRISAVGEDTDQALAEAVGLAERHVSRQLRLAYLAPEVLKRLTCGREASAVSLYDLCFLAGGTWQEQAERVFDP